MAKHKLLATSIVAVLSVWLVWRWHHCHDGDLTCLKQHDSVMAQQYDADAPLFFSGENVRPLLSLIDNKAQRDAIVEAIDRLAGQARQREAPLTASHPITCAVIGNSPNLLDSHYGHFIDEHTYVFRMNNAPIKGFAVDVGTRTSYHVVQFRFAFPRKYGEHTTTILLAGNLGRDYMDPAYAMEFDRMVATLLKEYAAQLHPDLFPLPDRFPEKLVQLIPKRFSSMDMMRHRRIGLHKYDPHTVSLLMVANLANPDAPPINDLFASLNLPPTEKREDFPKNISTFDGNGGMLIMHSAFLYYINENWFHPEHRSRLNWPSTGFKALIMALHMCDKVDAFGFGGTNDKGRWEHYNGAKPNKTGGHLPHYQNEWLDDMDRRGIIKLYKGSGKKYSPNHQPPADETAAPPPPSQE